ncbi:MAG: hypothetical protein JRN15_07025, partial [Nitrososphaerota archaeon]|nr:hypothetical protein [Nitrososphaerota archaeon]
LLPIGYLQILIRNGVITSKHVYDVPSIGPYGKVFEWFDIVPLSTLIFVSIIQVFLWCDPSILNRLKRNV